MSDMPFDLAARRWSTDQRVEAHRPRDCLAEMIRHIDAGEIDPAHVIVAYAMIDGEACSTGWLQAGRCNTLEQRGLLMGALLHMYGEGRR